MADIHEVAKSVAAYVVYRWAFDNQKTYEDLKRDPDSLPRSWAIAVNFSLRDDIEQNIDVVVEHINEAIYNLHQMAKEGKHGLITDFEEVKNLLLYAKKCQRLPLRSPPVRF